MQSKFISTFPGYYTSNNIFTLPEGANLRAENVVFTREDLIEPRHGIPPYIPQEVNASNVLTGNLFGIGPRAIVPNTAITTGFPNNITLADSLGFKDGDAVTLVASGAGTFPTGLTAGAQYYLRIISGTTYQLTPIYQEFGPLVTQGTASLLITQVSSYQSIGYFRTLVSETFIASREDSNGAYRFYEIQPQDYEDPLSVPRYRQMPVITSISSTSSLNPINSSGVSNTPFRIPRFIQNNNGMYVSNPRGWQVAQSSTFPTTTLTPTQIPTAVINFSSFDVNYLNNATFWFDSNYAVDIVLTVVTTKANGVEIEGRPSAPYTIKNRLGMLCQPILNLVTTSQNPTTDKIRVYRTAQYRLPVYSSEFGDPTIAVEGQPAPTQYVQAGPDVSFILFSGVGTGVTTLTFNDEVINNLGLPSLYTSSNIEGNVNAHFPPPICSDGVGFKSHAVYGDVLTTPTAELQLLSVDATTNPTTSALNGQTFTLAGKTWTFQNRDYGLTNYATSGNTIPVEVNPVNTLNSGYGIFDTSLGYIAPGVGINTSAYINVYIDRTVDRNPQISGGATWTAAPTATYVVVMGTNNTPELFNKTGGFVYAYDLTGTLAYIFKYNDLTVSSVTATFSGVSLVGGDTIATSTSVELYFLPGVGVPYGQNSCLQLYLGAGRAQAASVNPGADPLNNQVVKGTSVALTTRAYGYYCPLPSDYRLTDPIGTMYEFTANTTSADGQRLMRVRLNSYGISDRSITTRIADTALNIVNFINGTLSTNIVNRFYAVADDFTAGLFRIVASNFESILLSVGASGIGGKFEPPLTTTPTAYLSPGSSRVKNGLVISKLGFPELVPAVSYSVPEQVGSSANRILRLAATQDDIYAFKENEGVFRISLEPGVPGAITGDIAPPPVGPISIVQIDGTIRPVAPEAVAVLDNVVYFLSDRGFHRISTNLPQYISKAIEQEVKTALARTPTYEGIRAYSDRVKNIYVCYFPRVNVDGSGVSFVFNARTELWSTSTEPFDWAVQDQLGRMTTIASSYVLEGGAFDEQDVTTVRNWNYARQEQFTGQLVDASGQVVNTFNIVDASVDQYDEHLTNITTDLAVAAPSIEVTTFQVGTKPDVNTTMESFLYRVQDKQVYLKGTINGIASTLVPITPVSFTTTIPNVCYFSFTDGVVPTTVEGAELYVGVNTVLDFVPLHGGSPETLKMFSRYGTHYQQRPQPDSLPSRLTFAFAVDNQSAYSVPVAFSTVVAERTIYETIVPLTAARGRFLKVQVKHNVPQEYFMLNGLAFQVRETNGARVTFK